MASLWNTQDDCEDERSIKKFTINELTELSLNEMLLYDMSNVKVIQNETTALTNCLGFCEQIVLGAYKVAEHIPDLNNEAHSKFWKEDLIPNLVECLSHDVRARSLIGYSFSSIRDLSNTIEKVAEIAYKSKSPHMAIQFAQKNVPFALETLEKYITEASNLENKAIEAFAEQTKQIFEIIGPQAVNYVDQNVDIECNLKQLYEKRNRMFTELGEKHEHLCKLNLLISATEKQVYSEEKEKEERKRRADTINQLNDHLNNLCLSISQSFSTDKFSGLWNLKTLTSSLQTSLTQSQEEDEHYYENLLLSRMALLKQSQIDEVSNQKVQFNLNECLDEHLSKYESALSELRYLSETLQPKMKYVHEQINNLDEKIKEISKAKFEIENMIGLQGETLLKFLIEVRTFAKTIKGNVSVYAPLLSILKAVKAMVENDVDLLLSSTESDIFLAGHRLLKQVHFLSRYSHDMVNNGKNQQKNGLEQVKQENKEEQSKADENNDLQIIAPDNESDPDEKLIDNCEPTDQESDENVSLNDNQFGSITSAYIPDSYAGIIHAPPGANSYIPSSYVGLIHRIKAGVNYPPISHGKTNEQTSVRNDYVPPTYTGIVHQPPEGEDFTPASYGEIIDESNLKEDYVPTTYDGVVN